MILYIMRANNGNVRKIAVIDSASSVIWVRRYNAPGEFEIAAPAAGELWRVLTSFFGELFVTREDSDIPMYIERIRMTEGAEGDTILINGRTADAVLDSRVVGYKTEIVNVPYAVAIRQLVNENLISPQSSFVYPDEYNRKLEPFYFESSHLASENITRTYFGENLLEAVDGLLSEKEWGLKCRLIGGVFTFELYSGQDRPNVVFSANNENLLSCEYDIDIHDKRNVVFVTAEGPEDTAEADGTNPYTISAQGGSRSTAKYARRESSMAATYTEYDETITQDLTSGNWEQGGYKWDGTTDSADSRIYCTTFFSCGEKVSVTASAGSADLLTYYLFYTRAKADSVITGLYGPAEPGKTYTPPKNAAYMRITLRRENEGVLLPADLTAAEAARLQKKSKATYRTDLEALGTPHTTRARQILQAEIADGGLFRPDADYFLGDTVHIVTAHGIKGAARVQELTEVEDAEGYRLYPTFSEWEIEQ